MSCNRGTVHAFPGGRRDMWRVAATMVVALVASGAVATPVAAAPGVLAQDRPCVEGAVDAAAARAAAVACGGRVEVTSAKTEYSRTFINPNGTATREQALEPVRVRQGNGWVPVDTTLQLTADGVAPRASALPMVFSAGGGGALARLSNRGRELSIAWQGVLPKPELSGNTALYREVLPGVDLKVTAEPLGFSEVLIVHSKEAAANPRLTTLRFGLSTKDVTVSPAPGGGLIARDAKGKRVFTAPAPLMWDSSTQMVEPTKGERSDGGAAPSSTAARDASADRASADGVAVMDASEPEKPAPTEGARRAVMPVQVVGGELVLTPDRALLDDPAVRFPVYIDPSWTGHISNNAWTTVWSKYPNSSFWQNSTAMLNGATYGSAGSGLVRDCDTCPNYVIRSMFQMDTSAMNGLHIISAQFQVEQRHAWTCSPASDAGLWLVGAISPSTTWNNQPYWNGSYTATTPANRKVGAVHGCQGPGVIEFNVTSMVSLAAAGHWGSMAVGLRAVNEGTLWQWKRFNHTSPRLSVTYNTDPNAPTNRLSDGKPCATGSARPYVLTTTPALSATQSDPDSAQQSLTTWFHWWPVGGVRNDADRVAHSAGNPATASASIPAGKLVDGGSYVWQAYTTDGSHNGIWSATCEFTVDATPPPTPASVTSTAYPADAQPHGGVGLEGVFTITAPTVRPHEVVAYAWTLDGGVQPSAAPTVPADSGSYGASISIRPTRDGVNQLRVWSKDHAGRFSASPVTYTFTVRAGSGPAAEWTFAETSGSATDNTGHGNGAALSGGATRTAGRGGIPNALNLNGSTAFAATAGPVLTPHPDTGVMLPVRTDTSFTVTARVNLTATGGTGKPTVVGADGTQTSAFTLGYSGPDNRWLFTMAGSDVAGPAVYAVLSNAAPTAGQWTHLAAVYDAGTHQLRLYVNGTAQTAVATLTGGFNAAGAITIGRGKWAGSSSNYFNGAVDDVRLYNFAETQPKLAALAVPLPPTVSFPAGNEATAGGTLQVRFDANGDTNVTTFKYSVFDDDLDLTATPTTPGGTATVTVNVGTTVGSFLIFASGQAGAGLPSQTGSATFQVNPGATLSGFVLDLEFFAPVEGAVVSLNPSGLQRITGPDGAYEFLNLTPGLYTVTGRSGGQCGPSTSIDVDIDASGVVLDLYLSPYTDDLGYTCSAQPGVFSPANDAVLTLSGDNAVAQVGLPFAFPFYGHAYYGAWVDTNGIVSFTDPGGSHPYSGGPMPDVASPNAVVAPFWDDLVVDASASVRTATVGSGAAQKFVIEWRNVHRKGQPTQRLSFEVLLAKDGTVTTGYTGLDNDAERGAHAAVGIEAPGGTDGLLYSASAPVLANGESVIFDYPGEIPPIEVFNLSGTLVNAAGSPVVGATVTLNPRGMTTTTGAGGAWAFNGLVADSYTITSTIGGRCAAEVVAVVDLTADTVRNLHLSPDFGTMGYACSTGPSVFVAASDLLALSGDDVSAGISLPFAFALHGRPYSSMWVSTNGFVSLGSSVGADESANQPMPTAAAPNAMVAPFWDDLYVDSSASMRTQILGSAPNRSFVVEWRNVAILPGGSNRLTFEVIFRENGQIEFHYGALNGNLPQGVAATVGIENADGTLGAQYSHDEVALTSNGSVVFTPAPPATVSGTLTAAGTGAPVGGATVTLTPSGATTTTAANGNYQLTSVPVGEYVVSAMPAGGTCAGQYAIETVRISGADADVDLSILGAGDEGGYTCSVGSASFITAGGGGHPGGDDVTWQTALPFPIALYGLTYNTAWVDTNGAITFINPTGGSAWDASPIPSPVDPHRHNAAVYPFWDDWIVDAEATIAHETFGTAPNRTWVVEWRNVLSYHDQLGQARVSFEVIFEESGAITFVYNDIDPANAYESGGAATVGIEDASGTLAFQYLRSQTWLTSGTRIRFEPGAVTGGTVSGMVTCGGAAVAGASVAVGSASTTTAQNGSYELTGMPGGAYSVIANPPGGACNGSRTAPAMVGNGTHAVVNFPLTATVAGAGYTVLEQPTAFIAADTLTDLDSDDEYTQVTLPFAVQLYGQSYSIAWVDTNGVVSFVDPGGSAWDTSAIPSMAAAHRTNAALYPLWDDWIVDAEASVRTATIGAAPNRKFVVEWRNVRAYEDADVRVSFEVILDEGGGYTFAYNDLDDGFLESGGGSVIGIENAAGTVALQYSLFNPVLRPGVGIRINPPTA